MPQAWTVARERSGDEGAIDVVHLAAFPGPAEAELVAALRARGELAVSLVADVEGAVVGHVAFSPARIDGAATRVVGLGPVAVLPHVRRRGVAEQLVRTGLDACREAGAQLAVVVGDPRYYRRFGFEPAAPRGLVDDYGAGEAFQVLELVAGAAPATGGRVHYADAFSLVDGDPATATSPHLALVLATGPNGELGRKGRLPYDVPSDRAFFARTTRGHAVLMGRRTWGETGAALPGRLNVVVSSTLSQLEGATVARSLQEAIAVARSAGAFPFVIGGAQLYREANALATRVYHTSFSQAAADADVFFQLDRARLREVSSWLGPRGERYTILAEGGGGLTGVA